MREKLGGPKKLRELQLLGRLRADGTKSDIEVREVDGAGWYVSEGEYGKVRAKKFTVKDRAEVVLAEKKFKGSKLLEGGWVQDSFSPEDIEKTLEVHRVLKNAGVKTFTTLRSDGRAFYSTMLNAGGRVALSHMQSPVPKMSDGRSYIDMYSSKLRIANAKEFAETLVTHIELAAKAGLDLTADSIFYLVPDEYKGEEFDLDFIVADFDMLSIRTRDAPDCYMQQIVTLEAMMVTATRFMRRFADERYSEGYVDIISEVLNAKADELYELQKIADDDDVDADERGAEGLWGGI